MKIQFAFVRPKGWKAPSDEERSMVSELLDKAPRGEFQIACYNDNGGIAVIENAPFFDDGTPMPTRYWLVDPDIHKDVSKLESIGGVKMANDHFGDSSIMDIHNRYRISRDELIDPQYDGPRPSGGVGGTRRGVKCLHTHVANYLVTGNDDIGKWVLSKIEDLKTKGEL